MTEEIPIQDLDPKAFIDEKVQSIATTVGDGTAINALSGGVDSATVTMLGHHAIGKRLRTYYVENGLMREGESDAVISLFADLGVEVELVDARDRFFAALKGLTDPEEKREAVTQTFYKDVFGRLVRESDARYLLQGTILTDVDETVAGIKRQHNVFAQLGIDTQKTFGYQILEPLVEIRKDGVRRVAEAVGLPESTWNRMPFPGPALAARVIGEVTPEKVALVRHATAITEEELADVDAFLKLAILHEDRVTGMRDGRREFGRQIEVRCWDSVDARTGTATRVSYDTLERLANRLVNEVPGVVSVTYGIGPKPPSTMEPI